MRRMFIGLGLLVVALTVCIWRLPASLLGVVVPPEARRLLEVHQASGTLWNGSVQLNVIGAPPALAIDWACRPSLSPPGAHCQLSGSIAGALDVNALTTTLVGEQLLLSVPLEISPAAGISAASTRVATTIQSLVLSQSALSLKANLRADDAHYRVGQSDTALGEVTVDCVPNAAGDASTCTLANRGGSARLDGRVTLGSSKATGTIELTPANGPVQRVSF